MTFTETELATLKASAVTLIADVVANPSPTLLELAQAKQAGYELGITTYDDLKTKIQPWIDSSASLSPDDLQRLRFLTMPSRIRAVVENDPQQFNSSQTITVPDGVYKLKVSFQAAGGRSGASYAGSGSNFYAGSAGGGGGAVFEYEMTVYPAMEISLVFGDTLTFGILEVEQGGNGADYYNSTAGRTFIFAEGGKGGRVLVNGTPFDDGVTAIAGTIGGSVTETTYTAGEVATTTNGKLQGAGGGRFNVGGANQYLGAGGGASPTSDGESPWTPVPNDTDTRPAPLGTGASSTKGVDTNGALFNDAVAAQDGGDRSPYVIINFVRQPA
tara:strand:- start:165997 stop:166983 length:987 start_codon:yes stop_codon:yes gene_type:complete